MDEKDLDFKLELVKKMAFTTIKGRIKGPIGERMTELAEFLAENIATFITLFEDLGVPEDITSGLLKSNAESFRNFMSDVIAWQEMEKALMGGYTTDKGVEA